MNNTTKKKIKITNFIKEQELLIFLLSNNLYTVDIFKNYISEFTHFEKFYNFLVLNKILYQKNIYEVNRALSLYKNNLKNLEIKKKEVLRKEKLIKDKKEIFKLLKTYEIKKKEGLINFIKEIELEIEIIQKQIKQLEINNEEIYKLFIKKKEEFTEIIIKLFDKISKKHKPKNLKSSVNNFLHYFNLKKHFLQNISSNITIINNKNSLSNVIINPELINKNISLKEAFGLGSRTKLSMYTEDEKNKIFESVLKILIPVNNDIDFESFLNNNNNSKFKKNIIFYLNYDIDMLKLTLLLLKEFKIKEPPYKWFGKGAWGRIFRHETDENKVMKFEHLRFNPKPNFRSYENGNEYQERRSYYVSSYIPVTIFYGYLIQNYLLYINKILKPEKIYIPDAYDVYYNVTKNMGRLNINFAFPSKNYIGNQSNKKIYVKDIYGFLFHKLNHTKPNFVNNFFLVLKEICEALKLFQESSSFVHFDFHLHNTLIRYYYNNEDKLHFEIKIIDVNFSSIVIKKDSDYYLLKYTNLRKYRNPDITNPKKSNRWNMIDLQNFINSLFFTSFDLEKEHKDLQKKENNKISKTNNSTVIQSFNEENTKSINSLQTNNLSIHSVNKKMKGGNNIFDNNSYNLNKLFNNKNEDEDPFENSYYLNRLFSLHNTNNKNEIVSIEEYNNSIKNICDKILELLEIPYNYEQVFNNIKNTLEEKKIKKFYHLNFLILQNNEEYKNIFGKSYFNNNYIPSVLLSKIQHDNSIL